LINKTKRVFINFKRLILEARSKVMLKKSMAVVAVLLLNVSFLGVNSVLAQAPDKVFVCKYIGKPGVDERLQTGQNPISVSVKSIKNFQGEGSYFNDKHGRSYVLKVDTGQPKPDVSECPQPDNPDPDPEATPVPDDDGDILGGTQVDAPEGSVDAGVGTVAASALGLGGSVLTLGYGASRFLRKKQ
jgi:hypothetical protein